MKDSLRDSHHQQTQLPTELSVDLSTKDEKTVGGTHEYVFEATSASDDEIKDDIYSGVNDDVLARKLALVNHALNEIGMTRYHYKLFFLNGMGYAVDSLLALLQSVTQTQINKEFNHGYSALISGNYVGLFFGALFWGFGADIIGRKLAFQITLFLCAAFSMATAGGLSYVAVCSISAVSYFMCGGNLILDAVTFLEFLPKNKQWMVTTLAMWWGVGQTLTCLIAWPLIANFSCESADHCPRSENMGWRYTFITSGGFVLLCATARALVIKMVESPKFDISNGNDENVIKSLDMVAASSGRVNPLTLERLQAVGTIQRDVSKKTLRERFQLRQSLLDSGYHLKSLFATKKLGWSTTLNFLSWALAGLAYPLFNTFLPLYLSSRGADFGDSSLNTTYKNNLIANSVSIAGPIIAGFMVEVPFLGRRGTMAVGAAVCMAFMFAYTAVRTQAQNLGISSAISVSLNVYLGVLYAYTPEVMPSRHRATGNGLSVCFNRITGSISPVVAYYANTSTSTPIYVMAVLMGVISIISMLFPYEIRGHNSV